ncbi:MAG: hypothetical protein IPI67_24310 [Myxococcales bacterium]|nr:hypothetical protein [Myxococcales bacterium]
MRPLRRRRFVAIGGREHHQAGKAERERRAEADVGQHRISCNVIGVVVAECAVVTFGRQRHHTEDPPATVAAPAAPATIQAPVVLGGLVIATSCPRGVAVRRLAFWWKRAGTTLEKIEVRALELAGTSSLHLEPVVTLEGKRQLAAAWIQL